MHKMAAGIWTTLRRNTLDSHESPACGHTGCRDISHLLDGIRHFRERFYQGEHPLMRNLAEHGQFPPALVISCSDSRVDPGLLTGADPGQLFVLRNVANLVPPHEPDHRYHGTGSAIEYAVRDLKVDHIIVIGHAHCGGIKAMLSTAGGDKPARVIPGRLAENPEIDEGAGVRVGDKAPASIPFPPVSLRRREMEQEKSVLNARKAATSRTP